MKKFFIVCKRFFLKRFLSFLACFLIVSSFFVFSVSADVSYNFLMSRPVIDDTSCYFEILHDGWAEVLFFQCFVSNGVSGDYEPFNPYNITFDFNISSSLTVTFGGASNRTHRITCTQIFRNGSFQTQPTYVGFNSFYTYNFPSQDTIYGIHFYGCSPSANISHYNSTPFTISYGDTATSEALLQSILSAIQARAGDAQSIINSANNNASAIQSNANANANAIQQNQQQQTDRFFTNDYSGADTTTTDDFHNSEQALLNSTSTDRDQLFGIFNQVGSLLNTGTIQKGMLFCTAMIKKFIDVPWLGGLILFSLAIGLVAFVLGLTSFVTSFSRRR